MGSFLLCIARRVPRVTFFRGVEEGVPMGECDEYLVWWSDSESDSNGVAALRVGDGRIGLRASEAPARRVEANDCMMDRDYSSKDAPGMTVSS